MLDDGYTQSAVLCIAAADNDDLSFSSDTGMAECLVTVRKRKPDESSEWRTLFASLAHRPNGFGHASALASKIASSNHVRQIEDGPYGGTSLMIGDDLAGKMITAPQHISGEVLGAVRISDYSIAQTAHALSHSRLWLPTFESPIHPNPPKDRDGRREDSGSGEGVTGAMIRARIWVDGRLGGGLQALLGAAMAAYSGCGEGDGGIGHGKRRSRTGLARVCGDVGLAGGSVADGRRQAGSGMARSRARARLNCSCQGPAPGKMQGQWECRAGDPSGQGKDPSSEGLGGHDLLTEADAGCPAGQVCAITCIASQAPLAAKRPDGRWFSPTPYFRCRMAFSTSAWRR